MAERIDMWHRKHGGHATTTADAYEQLWKPKGWRKTPPKPSSASADEPNQAGESAESQED